MCTYALLVGFLAASSALVLRPARPVCFPARGVLRRAEGGGDTPDAAGGAGVGVPVADGGAAPVAASPEEVELTERQKEIQRLKAAETFMEKETGALVCRVCDYRFDPESEGREWADVPSQFRCPRCKASKDAFDPVTITIAGFAENQGYGIGGNAMTEGDKNALIFGGIGFFFALLLSGYLLT